MTARDLNAQLEVFRATHRTRRADFAGATWSYYLGGSGPSTLLILPGAPGIAEMAFPYILAFEPHYRVLAPSYPGSVGSLDQLLSGLDELLASETDEPAHLIGASYSGLVAQCLLARDPTRVRCLLIGDTGVARPERARALNLAGRALASIPVTALHGTLFAVLTLVLWGRSPAHRFWQRYFKAVVVGLSGRELANRVGIMVQMDRQGPGSQTTLAWQGPTLLMETVNDPLFAPHERAALRRRFPHAERHTFYTPGHITALTRAPDYIAVMQNFLARHSPSAS